MRRLLPLLLVLLATWFSGCAGYTIGTAKPERYADIKTIAVNTVKNDVLEPRLDVLLANTIIKQIQQDGTYKIVRESEADAILDVNLSDMERRPSRSVNGNVLLAREYQLTLRAKYKFYRRGTGAVLEQRTVQGQTSFFVSGSTIQVADVNQDERQAIPLAAEDLAVRLTSMITEGW